MRPLSLAAAALLSAGAAAQPDAPHTVPFATDGNVLELVLAAADGAPAPRSVAVTSAPDGVVFEAPTVPALATGDEATAQLTFGVAREAPTGEPGALALAVLDGAGRTVATRQIRVEVAAPTAFALGLPRPNPVRTRARLPYELPAAARVEASVYDLLGRRVAVLVDDEQASGGHTLDVDAGALAAGAYVVRVGARFVDETRVEVRRVTVVR